VLHVCCASVRLPGTCTVHCASSSLRRQQSWTGTSLRSCKAVIPSCRATPGVCHSSYPTHLLLHLVATAPTTAYLVAAILSAAAAAAAAPAKAVGVRPRPGPRGKVLLVAGPAAAASSSTSNVQLQQQDVGGSYTMLDLYEDYWRPFGEVLTDMEAEGVCISRLVMLGAFRAAGRGRRCWLEMMGSVCLANCLHQLCWQPASSAQFVFLNRCVMLDVVCLARVSSPYQQGCSIAAAAL